MLLPLLTRKRKSLVATEERDHNEPVTDSRPRKRLRVQEPASIHEACTPTLAACAAGRGEGENSSEEKLKEEETVQELQAKVKELEEMNCRIKKEVEQVAAKLKKLKEEDVECMVCQDVVQNPQLLQCGHSACYRCLRNWWTQPPEQYDGAEMIDTEAEPDRGEEGVAGDGPNPEAADPAPPPRPRRRHQFSSAVNRKKRCPYCNDIVIRRPSPDFQLRDVIETLNRDLAPVPPSIQARRDARLTRRSDLWHGIFHPENNGGHHPSQQQGGPRREPQPGPPPPPHPDPILNHIAQEQHRRAVEAVVARQERVRAQAYEEGRMRGIWEIQMRWERAEQARQAALDRPILEQQFGEGNLPPAPDPAAM